MPAQGPKPRSLCSNPLHRMNASLRRNHCKDVRTGERISLAYSTELAIAALGCFGVPSWKKVEAKRGRWGLCKATEAKGERSDRWRICEIGIK
jgi:hypothetical protein